MKNIFKVVLFLFVLTFSSMPMTIFADTTPMTMTFEVVLATQESGLLDGEYDVDLRLDTCDDFDGTANVDYWEQSYDDVMFQEGIAGFILGTDQALTSSNFDISDPCIQIELDSSTAEFPLPAVPYSIQANVSEYVENVDAADITGTFSTTLNVQADVHVMDDSEDTIFYVDYSQGNVGVGTSNPNASYILDINGNINATEFLIDGDDIDELFSWEKNGDDLYYMDGVVGIGTSTPSSSYALDVSGTINATEYYRDGELLSDYLESAFLWQDSDTDGDIYFNDGTSTGKVGIGVSTNLLERLEVSGAIRIGESVQDSPVAGTIEFDSTLQDFIGYINGDSMSLIGVQYEGVPSASQAVYWTDDNTITGTSNLTISSDGHLSIGTTNSTALITLQGDGDTAYLDILDSSDNSVFVINSSGNVGVGVSEPDYTLDVSGIIDATAYYVNGSPLETSYSSESVWNYGSTNEAGTDIFYESGNVGIGTNEPANTLELASDSDDVALTYDIDGTDYFTMGVAEDDTGSFVISEGSDLTEPIFVFSGSTIGIGLTDPEASLHVSGNAGFLVEGDFGSGETISASGEGTRLFFFPDKAAFRAGGVTGTQWDDSSVGDYSIAMGSNNTASGNYSFIGGGLANDASGDYSAIPGGLGNEAAGDYSFAAGYYAEALHDGSFVWSDSTPTINPFSSSADNQFLIRAYGGVGINTSDTEDSTLTVVREGSGSILELQGTTGDEFVVDYDGGVGIGTTEVDNATLSLVGNVGIGTTDPSALFEIQNDDGSDQYMFYAESAASDATTPYIVITSTGNMGIGTKVPQDKLDVNGKIMATAFVVVDPDDPSATVTLQASSGSPWSYVEGTDYDIYRLQGQVGIGATTPNSILELSNDTIYKKSPAITFDLDDTNYYKIGIITKNVNNDGVFDSDDVFFALATSENFTADNAHVVVVDDSLILGRGVTLSQGVSLDVSGNALFDGKIAVATSNFDFDSTIFSVYVDGKLGVSTTLNINGEDFVQGDDPWITNENGDIYVTSNVGIGVTQPNNPDTGYILEVDGVVSANTFLISEDFSLEGDLYTEVLYLKDQDLDSITDCESPDTYGLLEVDSGELSYTNPCGTIAILSSPIQASDDDESGPLAFWVNDGTIGYTSLYWDNTESSLAISGNVKVSNYLESNGLISSSNVSFDEDIALSIETTLDHYGDQSVVSDYTIQKLDLSLQQDWGNSISPVTVIGMDIALNTEGDAELFNEARAIGLSVDVSSVNISSDQTASSYAAVFMGGNVGIGTSFPTAELEVNGAISANYFNISGGITVPELLVDENNYSLYVTAEGVDPRVGIGVTNPSVELEVDGTVSMNSLIVSNGLISTSMNIGSGTFVIDGNGNIGIGTTVPSASFEVVEVFDEQLSDPYIAEKIDLSIDGVDKTGSTFTFSQDITALKLTVDSGDYNYIEDNTLKGLNIDFSELEMKPNSLAYGMYVDVSDTYDDGATRYAAIFDGGYVGIGTTEPQAELHVSGNVIIDDLMITGGLDLALLTVNTLVVQGDATMAQVTVNELTVVNDLIAGSITLTEALSVASGNFSTLNATSAVITNLTADFITINSEVSAASGYFSTALGIGTSSMPDSGLEVVGGTTMDSLTIDEELVVSTLNVNSGSLFMGSAGYLGVGTASPDTLFHVVFDSPSTFSIDDNKTWNAMKLGLSDDVAESSVGFLLAPSSTPSQSVGAGILAVANSDATSSDLLFVTDPSDNVPTVTMRLTSEGYVGINTNDPQSALDVNGDVNISEDLSVSGELFVSSIKSLTGTLTLGSSNDDITFTEDLEVQGDITVNGGLVFTPLSFSSLTLDEDYGYLYVDDVSNDLYFVKPGSTVTSINITAAYSGDSSKIPFFDGSGSFDDSAPLYWDSSTDTMTVGDSSTFTQFNLISTYNFSTTSEIVANDIQIKMSDRVDNSSTAEFIGMNIEMSSYPSYSSGFGDSFGRLGDGETAIGLYVDMTDLIASYGNDNTQYQGYKYAGVFNGGSVGIGTDTPEALLHVVENSSLDVTSLFRVDNESSSSFFEINDSGLIGIGTDDPDALVHIKGDGSSLPLFQLVTNSTTLLYVDNNNVGIGTNSPDDNYALEVDGAISANVGVFDSIEANSFTIGSDVFTIDSSGDIKIGTDNILGNLTIYGEIDDSVSSAYNGQILEIDINESSATSGDTSGTPFEFYADLTGLNVSFETADNNTFGADGQTPVATGVSINLSSLSTDDDASVIGLYVNPGSSTTGTRYAAVFDGNVGIATENPSYDLTVEGTISAEDLILSNSLSVGVLTTDELNVSGDVTVTGELDITTLYANTVSVNTLKVYKDIAISTGSFQTVTVNNYLYVESGGTFGVGSSNQNYDVYISGDAYISGGSTITSMSVSSIQSIDSELPVTFSSDIIVDGTVSANKFYTDSALVFNPVTTISDNTSFGQLYTSTSGDLIYKLPGDLSSTLNLTAPYSGTATRIPYYDSSGSLSYDIPFGYTESTSTLTLGDSSTNLSFDIISDIDNDTSSFTAHSIDVSIDDRSGSSETNSFKGLDISISSYPTLSSSEYDFGRLGENETAIGLNVDLSDLVGDYSSSVTTEVNPRKYSAVFSGGLVGVGITTPEATLHVKSQDIDTDSVFDSTDDIFRIDSSTNSYAFLVDESGNVGLGTSDPDAQLTIKQLSSESTDIFAVEDTSSSDPILRVTDSSIGINMSYDDSLDALLVVSGNVLFSDSSNAANFFVTSNRVGVGTSSPTSIFQVEGDGTNSIFRVDSNASEYAFYVDSTGDVGIGTSSTDYGLTVDGIVMSSDGSSISPPNTFSSYSRGFLSSYNGEFAFMGQVTENQSTIIWGDDTNSTFEFAHYDGNEVSSLMTLDPAGYVGIAHTAPEAALHVSGNFLVGSSLIDSATNLIVTDNKVGIGTTTPQELLDVNGSITSQYFNLTDGGISLSTINITGELDLEMTVYNYSEDVVVHGISLNVGEDMKNNLYGLSIDLASSATTGAEDDDYYLIYGGADAVGLYVNMSDLVVADSGTGTYGESNYGNKYAAVFYGGPVGIGTLLPDYPLHVKGQAGETLAGFSSSSSILEIDDMGDGTLAFQVINQQSPNQDNLALVFAPGDTVDSSGYQPAFVGIGVTDPDKPLVVNGDVRVGAITTDYIAESSDNRYGSKLYFSGSKRVDDTIDSDNGDDLWMARYNNDEYDSHLRINFSTINEEQTDEDGVAAGLDQFMMGFFTDSFQPVLKVHNNNRVSVLGSDTTLVDPSIFVPDATFQVIGSAGGNTEDIDSYLTILENTTTDTSSSSYILGLYASGLEADEISDDLNFITFYYGSGTEIGAIEGNNNSGIRYKTVGADYAEYLAKRHDDEVFQKGDIVGVIDGTISKNTADAQQLMVLSSSAAVAGNWPGEDESGYELVSFFGQVMTKVRGVVTKGDFILSSQKHDGTGIAVSKSELTLEDRTRIVGRAWESSDVKDVKLINTAVGFAFGSYSLNDELEQISSLELSLQELVDEKNQIVQQYENKFSDQQKEIDDLIQKLSQ